MRIIAKRGWGKETALVFGVLLVAAGVRIGVATGGAASGWAGVGAGLLITTILVPLGWRGDASSLVTVWMVVLPPRLFRLLFDRIRPARPNWLRILLVSAAGAAGVSAAVLLGLYRWGPTEWSHHLAAFLDASAWWVILSWRMMLPLALLLSLFEVRQEGAS